MDLPLKNSFDEIFSQLTLTGPHLQAGLPKKVLFWGEGAGEISSYVSGWMGGKGIDVIVLDGANRFDPYVVSSIARSIDKGMSGPRKLTSSSTSSCSLLGVVGTHPSIMITTRP